MESTLNWQRPNDVEQRVVGYRARSVTRNVSARTYFKRPWITPLMYGNRLPLLLSRGTGANALESAVHPFASDRDRYYRFSGGDTVEVLHSNGRSIPIVRIQVEPNMVSGVVPLLLRGEIDVDASRFQVVRMRGEFVRSGAHTALPVRAIPRGGRHDLHYAARLSRGVDRALADGH